MLFSPSETRESCNALMFTTLIKLKKSFLLYLLLEHIFYFLLEIKVYFFLFFHYYGMRMNQFYKLLIQFVLTKNDTNLMNITNCIIQSYLHF